MVYYHNPLGFQRIMPHSFSLTWSPFYKVSLCQPYLYIDPALLAMDNWIRSVNWSKLDKSDTSGNLNRELRTMEQSCVWLKLELKNSGEVAWQYSALWSQQRKRKKRRGGREEERIEREEKKKIVTKGKSKGKKSEFLTIFQFLVTAPSCPWDNHAPT